MHEDGVAMAWYKMLRRSDSLILVEDQVSAIRMAPHMHSAALLGTHINDDKAEEIRSGKYKTVIIALDNDATHEAIKLQLKWAGRIRGLFIRGLAKDIKDMNDDEFKDFLESIPESVPST